MVINKEKTENIVALIKKEYPNWAGFSHPKFVKDEIDYKQSAALKARELLDEKELLLLQSKSNFEEIITRIKKIGNATNLLWNWMPAKGDLGILEQAGLDKRAFCGAFIDLLYGPGQSPERLERYLNFVRSQSLPNKWTFPTYFLFLCHPQTEMFIKPRAMKRFLEFLGTDDVQFRGAPSSKVYSTIKQISHQLKEELKEFGPIDMIDIQSAIYLTNVLINNINILTKEKRVEFLKLFREFADSYLLSPDGLKHIASYDLSRVLARKNLEEIRTFQESGGDITDLVILKLLPYSDTDQARNAGHFISPGWVFKTDARKKLEGVGFVDKSDWPLVARNVLEFVSRCDEDPDQLQDACADFAASPLSKGFQTGTLTPILAALHPDQFVLINNKSREVLNYFAEKSYQQSIADYPKANETALSLLKGVSEDIRAISKTDLPIADLFDMFSHWYVAIRPPGVSKPLSKIFVDLDEAKWAFSLLKETLDRLGVISHDDERFAITLPKNGRVLRLNFGPWLVLGFKNPELTENRITLTFIADLAKVDDSFVTFNFARSTGEPDVRNYSLPIEMVRPLEGDLRNAYEKTLDYIKNKFGPWKKTIWRKHNVAVIGEAIFDKEKLEKLFSEELTCQTQYQIYTIDQLATDTFKDTSEEENIIMSWLQSINRKGQAILYGPPGTGKTFLAEHLARHLVSGGDGFVDMVQFHPAYAYEDFMQGIRPQVRQDGTGALEYCIVPGRFFEFCRKARERDGTCVLIIDEINRANLARVFGELMYLLEYRDKDILLSVDGARFQIPENVRIIGTMNTADRSIALVDHALRRRFAFIKLQPDYDVLKRYHQRENTGFPVDRLIPVLQDVNRSINDSNYEIGISYFMKPDLMDHLEGIWRMEIEPYLEEYFFDNPKNAERFRWERVRPILGL